MTFSANDASGSIGANHIIWNFLDAGTVSLDNQIDGALVADNFVAQSELHDNLFDGALSPTVPESGSLVLLATGLIGLGFVVRRRCAEPCRMR